MCADVQRRKLRFGIDESVYREAKFDGAFRPREHQHECIADLLNHPARALGDAAAHKRR